MAPFLPPDVLGNPALILRDRVHPNAAGTELIARSFLPAVEAALQASSGGRPDMVSPDSALSLGGKDNGFSFWDFGEPKDPYGV